MTESRAIKTDEKLAELVKINLFYCKIIFYLVFFSEREWSGYKIDSNINEMLRRIFSLKKKEFAFCSAIC